MSDYDKKRDEACDRWMKDKHPLAKHSAVDGWYAGADWAHNESLKNKIPDIPREPFVSLTDYDRLSAKLSIARSALEECENKNKHCNCGWGQVSGPPPKVNGKCTACGGWRYD